MTAMSALPLPDIDNRTTVQILSCWAPGAPRHAPHRAAIPWCLPATLTHTPMAWAVGGVMLCMIL